MLATSILFATASVLGMAYGTAKASHVRETIPDIYEKYGKEYCMLNWIPREARIAAFKGILFYVFAMVSFGFLVSGTVYLLSV